MSTQPTSTTSKTPQSSSWWSRLEQHIKSKQENRPQETDFERQQGLLVLLLKFSLMLYLSMLVFLAMLLPTSLGSEEAASVYETPFFFWSLCGVWWLVMILVLPFGKPARSALAVQPVWRNALDGMLLVFLGVFNGGLLFSLIWLNTLQINAVAAFEKYEDFTASIFITPDNPNAEWFAKDGSLLADKSGAWCALALTNMDQYASRSARSRTQGRNLSLLLASSRYNLGYQKGCLNDQEWLTKRSAVQQKSLSTTGYEDHVTRKNSWFPIIGMLQKTDSILADKLTITAFDACQMIGSSIDMSAQKPGALVMLCLPYSSEDPAHPIAVTAQELPNIRAHLQAGVKK